MADIHMYPAKIGEAAEKIRTQILPQWETQLGNYTAARLQIQAAIARGYVAGAEHNWFGGPGTSGQVQDSSAAFLQVLLRELDRLIQEKTDFKDSFTAYLNYVAGRANELQSADNAAATMLNSILKRLDGGR